jgi:phenylpyruvate tautomerase PptA (4-oxalocrotonate tautomerase family)
MPRVLIEVRRGRSPDEKRSLLEAVHQAIRAAFRTPEWDRTQRIREYEPEDFEMPPGRSDRYTLITIDAFPGRSPQAKRQLYGELVRRCGALGMAPEDLFVVLHEPDLVNWGIRGQAASDIQLSFDTNV